MVDFYADWCISCKERRPYRLVGFLEAERFREHARRALGG